MVTDSLRPIQRSRAAFWHPNPMHTRDRLGGYAARGIVAMSGRPVSELALRWLVTVFFASSIAAYVYIVVPHYRRWPDTVSHVVHLAMSAACVRYAAVYGRLSVRDVRPYPR